MRLTFSPPRTIDVPAAASPQPTDYRRPRRGAATIHGLSHVPAAAATRLHGYARRYAGTVEALPPVQRARRRSSIKDARDAFEAAGDGDADAGDDESAAPTAGSGDAFGDAGSDAGSGDAFGDVPDAAGDRPTERAAEEAAAGREGRRPSGI